MLRPRPSSRCSSPGMLNGTGGIKGDSSGNSDEDIVVRIKADAPVLKPDEPIPARPVL